MKIIANRKWALIPALLLSAMTFVFCSENDVHAMDNMETPDTANGKTLVAYFSRANYVPEGTDGVSGATNKAGNTQIVAYYISQKTNGDIFEIVPEKNYPVSHSECSAIAQEEVRNNERPALKTHIDDIDEYSTIFVGFPIWVYREPMAVLTFLEEYDFSGKTVIPFCTSMAVSIDQSMEDFRNTLPGVNVKQGIQIGYTLPEGWRNDVDSWLTSIGMTNSNNQEDMKIQIKVGNHTLTATLENNSTTRALVAKFPITLPMMDLYGREMCYRFPESLPTDDARTQGYEVGEIVYYPPMHSLVIMYAQNGERFQMQKLGHIDGDVSIFDGIGDVDVTWSIESSGIADVKSDNSTSISAMPGGVSVKGRGNIQARLYDLNGRMLNQRNGEGSVELSSNGYKGLAVVEVNNENAKPSNTKIIIR